MAAAYKWLGLTFLILIAILMFNRGLNLWSLGTNVDGDGIGVYFLGLEINDRVPEADIPQYAIGFFISGLITILISLFLLTRIWRLR